MRVNIVGVKKSSYERNGIEKVAYNYSGTKPYTDYELDNSECRGLDIVREYSSRDFKVEPGDVVDFVYEPGYEGKAVLVDIVMVKPVGGVPFGEKGKE